MENKKIVIDLKLDMVQYMRTIDDIVLEYFDVNGTYQPQIGLLNAMCIFYNLCVKESKFDKQYNHNITDAMDMKEIVADDEFISAFNDAIAHSDLVAFNFTTAYKQAMDIVDNRKSSIGNATYVIKNAISELIDSFNTILDGGNLEKIVDVANKISSGNINANTIVEAYSQSQRFKEVVNTDKEAGNNVIPINK